MLVFPKAHVLVPSFSLFISMIYCKLSKIQPFPLCYQSSDIDELNEAINNDLKQLDIWLQGCKLSLNVAKTNSMLVANKQKHNILKS